MFIVFKILTCLNSFVYSAVDTYMACKVDNLYNSGMKRSV